MYSVNNPANSNQFSLILFYSLSEFYLIPNPALISFLLSIFPFPIVTNWYQRGGPLTSNKQKMANGTCSKFLEEQIKKCDQRIMEFANEFQKQIDNIGNKSDREWVSNLQQLEFKLDSKLEAHAANLESKMDAKFSALIQALKRERMGSEGDKTPLFPTPVTISKNQWPMDGGEGQKKGRPYMTGLPRVELPMFTCENPKDWLRKCGDSGALLGREGGCMVPRLETD